MGGTFSKNGTHLHDKNTRKIYGWFSRCCRGIVTGCEQTSDKTTRTSREVKNVKWCFSVRLHLPEPLYNYATSIQQILTPAITSSTSSPSFVQPAVRWLHQTSGFTISTPTTTHNNLPWDCDTHVSSTHFTQVSRTRLHHFFSFHTDMINRTDCDVTTRYDTV